MDVQTKMALFAAAGGLLRVEPPEHKPNFEVVVQASARRGQFGQGERLVVTRTIGATIVDTSNLLMEAIEECIDELVPSCSMLSNAGLPEPAPLPQGRRR